LKTSDPLQSLLASKEERADQRRQIARKGLPSVSLSLNVPGFPKSNAVTRQFFGICLQDLNFFLKANRLSIISEDEMTKTDAAGEFFIAPLSGAVKSLTRIKQLFEDFEESHPLGRFLDVDLTDMSGNPVSSGKAKLCFFCRQKPADVCRRDHTHDLNGLRQFMFSEMVRFCNQYREHEVCRKISSMALKAILYEISLTPKPGLIDKFSNGSHDDMNFLTFIDSTAAIAAYFADIVQKGFSYSPGDPANALPLIRDIGLRMENDMFACTGKVNTQKGLIFLMGIALFACGCHFAEHEKFDAVNFREIVKRICSNITRDELEHQNKQEKTHGEIVFDRYAVAGARGEAEKGFPLVFDAGLPELQAGKELHDEDLLRAFLSIASRNHDTNILYRKGLDVLEDFKNLSGEILLHFDRENFGKLMAYCKTENISPGGSADLLALTIFIHFVIKAGNGLELTILTTTES
jgi:holo-ACP synthase / triphosphoribosyl-dephospho-CoA synthase